MTPRTALVIDELFSKHRTSPDHPECPERVESLLASLDSNGLIQQCQVVSPVKAEEQWILSNHSKEYLERLRTACTSGQAYIDCMDSTIGEESFDIALYAAGSVLSLVDAIVENRAENALAVVRPPGHHAEHGESMGFCLFNNVAIAARYLLDKHQLERVLILDWDVHHGNGTQHSFEEEPRVFYCSFHGHPATLYPGTGLQEECGSGRGKGTTLNFPMIPGSGDAEYREAFEDYFVPAFREFKPEFVLVSAGFDAHRDDYLSNIMLDDESYQWLTVETIALAKEYCQGRLLSVLEGGYDLDALSRCVSLHLQALIDAATVSSS